MLPLLLVAALGQGAPVADPRLDEALRLLRPHLTWHAPVAPPVRADRVRVQTARRKEETASPWQEALGPLPAQRADIPRALVAAVERLARDHPDKPPVPTLDRYAWRLKDPAHADVAKALALLEAIKAGPAAEIARRWAAEVRRNNTVLTFDVAGAYAAGRRARFVLDARNADSVTFKLYRIEDAEDLLRVLDRIGTDFVFRVHETEREMDRMKMVEATKDVSRTKETKPELPAVLKAKPLASWVQPLAGVRRLPVDTLRDPYQRWAFEEEEANRYDDECQQYRERLQRSYLPYENVFSTWRAGLVLDVPAEHLKQPGAYLLQVEANGQLALAPILVEPPALTLRRCPDGVLAVVGTEAGKTPLAGATVLARATPSTRVAPVKTDAEGVAFLRVFARGDRAIVAQAGSNFAVGGFGAVFAGVYITPEDERHAERRGWGRDVKQGARRQDAQLFADGLIVALWTDRPVYRPGETVHAKVIVRRRVPRAGATGFRADEYDAPALELVPEKTATPLPVAWQLLDPGRQVVVEGVWKLNDHGTAAGDMRLAEKGPRGPYLLRAKINGRWYLLPEVFLVDEFFRSPADLEITGVPEKLEPGCKLELALVGRHVNGLPASKGQVTLTLASATLRWNLTPDPLVLDQDGKAKAALVLPRHLPDGRLSLRGTLTETGGVTTTRAISVAVEARAGPLLGKLPKFVPVDRVFVLTTKAAEIELEQGRTDSDPAIFRTTRVPVVHGQAKIAFPGPGWYTVRAGAAQLAEEQDVFVYGGKGSPRATCTRRQLQANEDDHPGPWIDLAHNEDRDDRWNRAVPTAPLLALFASQDGNVGDSVSVLVYVPRASARLLLTIEGHSVVDYRMHTVAGGQSHYHVLEIPLRDRYAPHFYLQGCILGGTGADSARERVRDRLQKAQEKLLEEEDAGDDPEWCKIRVRGAARPGGLKVAVRADRADYEPGDRVTLEVRTTDAAGKPIAAELALAAVDARLFALAGDRLPAVLATLTGARAAERLSRKTWRSSPGVRKNAGKHLEKQQSQQMAEKALAQADLRRADWERLLDRPTPRPLDELGELPVSVVPLSPVRDPGRETAFWTPALRTDAEGKARVQFVVPGNLTRYRVSVLGLTKSGLIGSSRTTFRASKRLEVEVLVPPELIVGHARELAVQVRNATDRERQVEVTATLTGLEWAGHAPARTRRVTVPARGVATVHLSVVARKEGPGSVRVQVVDGVDDDAETRPTRVVPLPPKEPASAPPPGR